MRERLRGTKGKGRERRDKRQEMETAECETCAHSDGRYGWAEMKDRERPGCVTKQADDKDRGLVTQRKPDLQTKEAMKSRGSCLEATSSLHVPSGTV